MLGGHVMLNLDSKVKELLDGRFDPVDLLLFGVALKEIFLALLVFEEVRKVDEILDELDKGHGRGGHGKPDIDDLRDVNDEINRFLRHLILKEVVMVTELEAGMAVEEQDDKKHDDKKCDWRK